MRTRTAKHCLSRVTKIDNGRARRAARKEKAMARLTFEKQSISPNVYVAHLVGYPRRFAELRKARGASEWTIEIDGIPAKLTDRTLREAKATVYLAATAAGWR